MAGLKYLGAIAWATNVRTELSPNFPSNPNVNKTLSRDNKLAHPWSMMADKIIILLITKLG